MSNRTRLIIAMVSAAALAMLAAPAIADKLPPGLGPALALGIAAALHRMNAEKSADDGEAKADKTAGDA